MHMLEFAIFKLAEVLEKNEKNEKLSAIAYTIASESHNYIPDENSNEKILEARTKDLKAILKNNE